jgi:hypothetical protein
MAMAAASPLALQLLRYAPRPRLGALYRLRTKPASGVASAASSSYHGEAAHAADTAAATEEVPREVGFAEQVRVTRGRERRGPHGGGRLDKQGNLPTKTKLTPCLIRHCRSKGDHRVCVLEVAATVVPMSTMMVVLRHESGNVDNTGLDAIFSKTIGGVAGSL